MDCEQWKILSLWSQGNSFPIHGPVLFKLVVEDATDTAKLNFKNFFKISFRKDVSLQVKTQLK